MAESGCLKHPKPLWAYAPGNVIFCSRRLLHLVVMLTAQGDVVVTRQVGAASSLWPSVRSYAPFPICLDLPTLDKKVVVLGAKL